MSLWETLDNKYLQTRISSAEENMLYLLGRPGARVGEGSVRKKPLAAQSVGCP